MSRAYFSSYVIFGLNEKATPFGHAASQDEGFTFFTCFFFFFSEEFRLIFFQGILFKFALDSEVAPGTFLYGGKQTLHEKAMKAANHELKGLECYWTASNALRTQTNEKGVGIVSSDEQLNFPLLSLIKYRGFTLTAMCLVRFFFSFFHFFPVIFFACLRT